MMKDKQLGGTKYLRIGLLKLPAGIFLGMTGRATAAVSVSCAILLLISIIASMIIKNGAL